MDDVTPDTPSPDEPVPEVMPLDDTELGFVFSVPSGLVSELTTEQTPPEPPRPADNRLYVTDGKRWNVQVKRNSDSEYCYQMNPGDEYFHSLLDGEVYVQQGHEKYCLNCALRLGFITWNRLFWQRREGKPITG